MWSRDAATGRTELKRVKQTFVRYSVTLVLTFSDGEKIETTKEHPFYVEGRGFVPAGEMGIGTSIVTRAGPAVQLVAASVGQAQKVFNFEVEDFHTYFVGNSHLWVHNQCTGQLNWSIVKQLTGETRTAHVRLHNVDDLTKKVRGVFYEDGVTLVNEAWQKAVANGQSVVNSGGTDQLVVDMGRIIGRSGGSNVANGANGQLFQKITIVLKAGTNQIITAFPM